MKRHRLSTTTATVLLATSLLTSKAFGITGTVTDTNGTPLPNISVTYLNSRTTYFSDSSGLISNSEVTPISLHKQTAPKAQVSVANNQITFSLATPEQISLQVTSANGRILFDQREFLSAGSHSIAVPPLAKGIYFLTGRIGNAAISQKFITRDKHTALPAMNISVRSESTDPIEEPTAIDTLIIYHHDYEEIRVPLTSYDDNIDTIQMIPKDYIRTEFPKWWALVYEEYYSYDTLTVNEYTPDSTILSISIEDSMITYSERTTGGITLDSYPYEYNSAHNYCVAGDYLVLSRSNGKDHYIKVFEQISGYWNAGWAYLDYQVPEEIQGQWIVSEDLLKLTDEEGMSSDTAVYHDIYGTDFMNNVKEVVKIGADSIYIYTRKGWDYDSTAVAVKDTAEFLTKLTPSDSTLTFGRNEFNDSWAEYESKQLVRNNEDITKWLEFTPAEEYLQLEDNKYSTHTVSLGDTLWFEFPVEKSLRYDQRTIQENCKVEMMRLDAEKKQDHYLSSAKSSLFGGNYTGSLYLAVIVREVADSTITSTFSINIKQANW